MRIVFLVPGNKVRSGELTGHNIRYGGTGASGTESSIVYVSEYLSNHGFEVTIASEKCDTPILDRGVFYTDFNFKDVENRDYDILVSCLWFEHYNDLPITVSKGIVYWYHLAWGYNLGELRDYAIKNNIKTGSVSISEWAKKFNSEYDGIIRVNDELLTTIIPNPVALDVIDEVLQTNPERKNHKVIFHAQWSRGGQIAKDACNEMNWSDLEFKSFDYINAHGGIDKKKLFEEIATSEYFVFPQLTHGKLVYKDTFSLSVAEAIALGVIVITYPLGALPEYFGDYCEFLPYPEGCNVEKLNTERVSEEPKLDYTKNIVDLLNQLETNIDYKNEQRIKGINYIKENFNIDKIGSMWVDYLNKF